MTTSSSTTSLDTQSTGWSYQSPWGIGVRVIVVLQPSTESIIVGLATADPLATATYRNQRASRFESLPTRAWNISNCRPLPPLEASLCYLATRPPSPFVFLISVSSRFTPLAIHFWRYPFTILSFHICRIVPGGK